MDKKNVFKEWDLARKLVDSPIYHVPYTIKALVVKDITLDRVSKKGVQNHFYLVGYGTEGNFSVTSFINDAEVHKVIIHKNCLGIYPIFMGSGMENRTHVRESFKNDSKEV